MRNLLSVLVFSLAIVLIANESAKAQTFKVLYTFTGGTDGGEPDAGMIRDAQGNLYGTTVYSGDLSCVNENGGSLPGCGVVFKLDTTGNESVLHTFMLTDGALPEAPVISDTNGKLYGTTARGGAYGWGTVFEVDTSGNETVVHSFNTNSDGWGPSGGLLLDKTGDLYGDSYNGGTNGYGTLFKVDATGTETVLHNFTGADGAYPYLTSLVMDRHGNLYGVTYQGGSFGQGTVYELNKKGVLTVLHSFAGGTADGCLPTGTLSMDNEGNLYGTTNSCGSSGLGTVWKLSENGFETVLHSFVGSDGEYPYGGVILDAKGNLYGVTGQGGSSDQGTLYELNRKGALTLLHTFTGSDGKYSDGGLILDANGTLYGTALGGGTYGYGTVFELTPPAATTTTLTSVPNPSKYGQEVTFTANVIASAGAPPDGETISFMKGMTPLGTGTLSSGSASFVTSALKAGATAVKAVYGGDSGFLGSKSNAVKQVVQK